MAQQYDIVYPPQGRVTFEGGLNNKFPRTVIQDNESPDTLNIVYTNGAAETRGGTSKLNTTSIGSFAGDGLYTRHDNTGTETMVVFAGTYMWQLTGSTTFTTVPSATSVFTAGVRVATTEYENKMFIGNGFITPRKYDGTYFTRHGVPAPTATATVVTGAAGAVPIGDWVYVYTYVNSASVEGNVSPVAATFTVAASSVVSLTAIGVAPQSHGVSSRRVYRATTTAGPFKLVGTIADNTTTTFTDTTGTATTNAPTDNGEPPNYSTIVSFQNRLFCNDAANPNYVWYSESLEPYTFGALNFLPIGDASFDLVRGLAVYNNGILVQCENALYLIYMASTTPTDWSVIKLLSQYGSKSPFGSFLYDNKCMVPAMQNSKFAGFAAVMNQAVTSERSALTTSIASSDRTSDKIEPDVLLIQQAYASRISSFVFKNKAYVAVPYGVSATDNSRAYVFDFSRSSISGQEFSWEPVTGITPSQFTAYGGNLYYLDAAATGFVNQMETTSYSDNGTAINSYLWTKEFSGLPGHENLQKDFRKVKLLVDLIGAYYMSLTYRTDSDSGSGTTVQVSLDPGSALWGTLTWGAGLWGAGKAQQEITVYLGQATGKRIQFQFSNQNSAGQRFKVHGLNFTYNIKGKR
mgnify:CR=1 FL=1